MNTSSHKNKVISMDYDESWKDDYLEWLTREGYAKVMKSDKPILEPRCNERRFAGNREAVRTCFWVRKKGVGAVIVCVDGWTDACEELIKNLTENTDWIYTGRNNEKYPNSAVIRQ